MQLVWFKRDLRINDHEALTLAISKGPILPLYILEPELFSQPDLSYRHYQFLKDCLIELDESLQKLGQNLIIKIGSATDILKKINRNHPIQTLWSHQETWNNWTYQRDKKVRQLTRIYNIQWNEPRQNGVIRNLDNRNGWSKQWYAQMK